MHLARNQATHETMSIDARGGLDSARHSRFGLLLPQAKHPKQ